MKFKRMRKIEKAVSTEICKLGEKELVRLIGECKRMTTTNCGWMEYGLREIATAMARARLRWFKAMNPRLRKSLLEQSKEMSK